MLPGVAVQPQHVMQLLPGQTEIRVVGVCVRVRGVIGQQDALQETEEECGWRKTGKENTGMDRRKQRGTATSTNSSLTLHHDVGRV